METTNESTKVKTTMLYLDGSKTAYRCTNCNSNCFHLVKEENGKVTFECNGCGDEYTAERDE